MTESNRLTDNDQPDSVLSKSILDYYRPPLQPLTDDEIDLIASVSGVSRKKVWVIAWLATMERHGMQQEGGIVDRSSGETTNNG